MQTSSSEAPSEARSQLLKVFVEALVMRSGRAAHPESKEGRLKHAKAEFHTCVSRGLLYLQRLSCAKAMFSNLLLRM